MSPVRRRKAPEKEQREAVPQAKPRIETPRATEEVQTESDDEFASLLQMLGGPGNADALRTLCRGAGFHATDDVLASGGGQTDEEGVLRKLAEAAMVQEAECALAA